MEAYKVLYLIRDLAKSMSNIGVKMDDYNGLTSYFISAS